MELEIFSQAKKLYTLAQKANLLEDTNFLDMFPDEKLEKIAHDLDKDRESFMANSREVEIQNDRSVRSRGCLVRYRQKAVPLIQGNSVYQFW